MEYNIVVIIDEFLYHLMNIKAHITIKFLYQFFLRYFLIYSSTNHLYKKVEILKYNKLTASLFFVGMLLVSGCGSSSNTKKPVAETPTPTVQILDTTNITTTSGEVIKVNKTAEGLIFEGHENKVVLLEVYGDTCPHCVEAIPAYNRLHAKYPNDVFIIALESYGTLTNASKQNYTTVAKANTGKMFSFIKDLTAYNLHAVPYLIMLSKDGGVVYHELLANFPEAVIETRIEQLK